jgi:hypothetical protein
MDQLSELRAAVQSDLTVGAESSLFPPATIDLAINRAYRKIGAIFKWEETKDALKTSSLENHEYYDYPQNWRPMSIWKLTLDAVDFGDPLTYKDYCYEKENDIPSGLQRMWSNYGKRYFIYPTPLTNGVKNIAIHGSKFVDKLVLDGDITIFSYTMPEINEAIVLEAGEILKIKGQVKTPAELTSYVGAELLSQQAKGIVVTAWTKVSQEQSKLRRTTPFLDVPDFFAPSHRSGKSTTIGNFD